LPNFRIQQLFTPRSGLRRLIMLAALIAIEDVLSLGRSQNVRTVIRDGAFNLGQARSWSTTIGDSASLLSLGVSGDRHQR